MRREQSLSLGHTTDLHQAQTQAGKKTQPNLGIHLIGSTIH